MYHFGTFVFTYTLTPSRIPSRRHAVTNTPTDTYGFINVSFWYIDFTYTLTLRRHAVTDTLTDTYILTDTATDTYTLTLYLWLYHCLLYTSDAADE